MEFLYWLSVYLGDGQSQRQPQRRGSGRRSLASSEGAEEQAAMVRLLLNITASQPRRGKARIAQYGLARRAWPATPRRYL